MHDLAGPVLYDSIVTQDLSSLLSLEYDFEGYFSEINHLLQESTSLWNAEWQFILRRRMRNEHPLYGPTMSATLSASAIRRPRESPCQPDIHDAGREPVTHLSHAGGSAPYHTTPPSDDEDESGDDSSENAQSEQDESSSLLTGPQGPEAHIGRPATPDSERAEEAAVLERRLDVANRITNARLEPSSISVGSSLSKCPTRSPLRRRKEELLSLVRSLELACPRNLAGPYPINVDRQASPQTRQLNAQYRAYLRFFMSLRGALKFLTTSQRPIFNNLDHLGLGGRRLGIPALEIRLMGHEVEGTLFALNAEVIDLMSAFISAVQPHTICRRRPLGLVPLGTPSDPFDLLHRPADRPTTTTDLTVVSVHVFPEQRRFNLYRDVDYLVGGRIRYYIAAGPDGDLMGFSVEEAPCKSQLHWLIGLYRELQRQPNWRPTEIEVVLVPAHRSTYFEGAERAEDQVVKADSGDAAERSFNSNMLARARSTLQEEKANNFRVISDTCESPWGRCPCEEQWYC